MKKAGKGAPKFAALALYAVVFYAVWTAWEFWGKTLVSGAVRGEALAQLVKSGVVKNLAWTLPAIWMVKRFETDVHIGLREMFTVKVRLRKYLPIFFCMTVYLLAGAVLQKGGIAIREEFGLPDLIIVLFVGITEEMVFRGWLLNATVRGERRWAAILVNALMFLSIHFPRWIHEGAFTTNFQNLGFLGVFLLSILFGWTFLASRSLWVPIALHMYWDLVVTMIYQ